jgi:hypothetical protein
MGIFLLKHQLPITKPQITKTLSRNTALVIRISKLVIIWNLVIGAWYFMLTQAPPRLRINLTKQ